ncbi:pre-mRNA-splicing factor ISY1 homolog isoform X1 [Nelusetta ayraudi]|uniref:pre-mRNA-splicing factor ISY1 homolog isoform X1 n=1 Tax=Nelusetta ayraudi TaxID=303726 RepID=UPI003F723257
MARNAEKAMTALARFRQAQLEEGKVKERRPFLASECSELPKAEKWRRQIISEVSKKVAQIQNAGLGEFRIRDLNDEINKLLREKRHWEVRIRELGGPDYARFGPRMLDHEGREVPGNRGYKYFGAARDLPGVRELFEKEPAPALRRTRGELMKDVDAEYYGYRDEDDGVLLPLEAQYEKQGAAAAAAAAAVEAARCTQCVCVCVCVSLQEAVQKWRAEKEARLSGDKAQEEVQQQEEEEQSIYSAHQEEDDEEEEQEEQEGEQGAVTFMAHVPVPSQKEVEEALVRRKKMELLQRYASETLQAQSQTAKTLMGL